MNKNRKLINALLVSTMMLTNVAPVALAANAATSDPTVVRLSGDTRVGTSTKVSDTAYESADTVVLAGYNGEVDALTGTALASLKDAPLLIVSNKEEDFNAIAAEIESLGAKNVILLGDTKVISKSISDDLKALDLNVSRVAGDDRFDTAIEVAKELGLKHDHVFLTNDGRSGELADALTTGPVSGRDQDPILLTSHAGLPTQTIKALEAMDVKKVTIVGGEKAVSAAVKSELENLGITVERVAGDNRWETAEVVANKYFKDSKTVIVANDGRVSYADALVGGYLGAKIEAPILLTLASKLDQPAKNFLGTNATFAYVLGGEKVVSKAALAEVQALVDANNVEEDLAVTSVSAINQTSLKITGEGLGQLELADITVEDNNATKITASADGKSATVELQSALVSEQATKVTVKENEESTKEFTVTYKFEVTSVSIEDQLFDDDRANQTVKFKVNGVDADMDYLTLNNYNVTFVAKNANTGAADNNLFGANTSATGVIANPTTKGAYTVEVQVTKAGEAMVTDKAEVSIVNLDAQTTALENPVFYNHGADKADDSAAAYGAAGTSADNLSGDDFVQNSTTFVAGESFDILRLHGTVAGEKQLIGKGDIVVTSSNDAVVSVDTSKSFTAESAGKATLTFKVGNVTKTVNVTVTNDKRELKKVTATPNSVKLVQTYSKDVVLKSTDQYGDPFSVSIADVTEVVPENTATTALVSGTITELETDMADSIGTMVATVTGEEVGKGSIFYKDATTGKVLGSVLVDVSDVANLGNLKLERIGGLSQDNTLALNADNTIVYELAQYNTNGVYMQGIDLVGKKLEVVDGNIATVQFTSDSGSTLTGTATTAGANKAITAVSGDVGFVVTAKKAGKTDILLKDAASGKQEKITITVTEDAFEVTNVDFKSAPEVDYAGKTINYKDVLSIIESNTDDILTGITLNKTTEHKVRISKNGGTGGTAGLVYLDINADGVFNTADDLVLGFLEQSKTTSSVFSGSAANAITGLTTVANDKGTVLFKFITDMSDILDADSVDQTTAIKATSVKVDVK